MQVKSSHLQRTNVSTTTLQSTIEHSVKIEEEAKPSSQRHREPRNLVIVEQHSLSSIICSQVLTASEHIQVVRMRKRVKGLAI